MSQLHDATPHKCMNRHNHMHDISNRNTGLQKRATTHTHAKALRAPQMYASAGAKPWGLTVGNLWFCALPASLGEADSPSLNFHTCAACAHIGPIQQVWLHSKVCATQSHQICLSGLQTHQTLLYKLLTRTWKHSTDAKLAVAYCWASCTIQTVIFDLCKVG